MRFFLALLTVAALALVVRAQQPSSNVCYQCPSEDEAGFALGESDLTSDPIFCSYPAFPGENPNDFYCTYNPSNGDLVTDNDAGFCPPTAVAGTCTSSRRRRRGGVPRAPQPASGVARDAKPKMMRTRGQLGASKKKRTV
jgi:hypothetical protein